jgi:thymidylate synthase
MIEINGEGVNELYFNGFGFLLAHGELEPSARGDVLTIDEPVIIQDSMPWQRVLLDVRRRANHAFHIHEAIWMLAGLNDARTLDRYVHDFSSRFAEPDGHMHGAYGFRWRKHFELEGGGYEPDQLKTIVAMLKKDKTTRRAVLQMWDPIADLGADVKDRPCNTQIFWRVTDDQLHMTVINRSNDAVWGAHGANAVHMSILHEVIADLVGLDMGMMYTFSNNYHVYTNVLEKYAPDDYLEEPPAVYPDYLPIRADDSFFHDCEAYMAGNYHLVGNYWLQNVPYFIQQAHKAYQAGDRTTALYLASTIKAPDWREGMMRWIETGKLK